MGTFSVQLAKSFFKLDHYNFMWKLYFMQVHYLYIIACLSYGQTHNPIVKFNLLCLKVYPRIKRQLIPKIKKDNHYKMISVNS